MFTFYKKDEVVDVGSTATALKQDIMEAAMNKLKIKELEAQIEALKVKANDACDVVFAVLDDEVTTIEIEEVGKITRSANTPRETLNKDKLKELLISKGLSAVVVKNCFDKATKAGKVNSPWQYKFTAVKEK